MENLQWFKFWGGDYLIDLSIEELSACERSCWVTLLCYASQSNGYVKNLSEYKLMVKAGVDPMDEEWQKTEGVLKRLEKLGMIRIDNEMITVINWGKRQERAMTGYERVKKHREKEKDDNGVITEITNDNEDDNARVEKSRIEKKREDNIAPTAREKKELSEKEKTILNGVNQIISIFYKTNKTIKFDNKTMRREVEELIKHYGLHQVLQLAEYAVSVQGKEYAPIITNPTELSKKHTALLAFHARAKAQKSKSGIVIV